MIHVTPGIGATIYGKLPRDLSASVIAACDHVTLHTAADASDVQSAAKVRAMGCPRVWLAIPSNYLVRLSDSAAAAEVTRCARVARDMGAEVFEFNGEGQYDGEKPGDWIAPKGATQEVERLENLARLIVDAALDVLPATCAIGWTSHDGTGFRVPRSHLPLIDLHSPQHYPAEAGRMATQAKLAQRIAWSRGQWEGLATRGHVPADVIPYGAKWSPYYQAYGHEVGALVYGLCEAPTARLWAYPGSWSAAGLRALQAARVIRANTDVTQPDVIARWQQAQGLEPDGIVGPRTLAACGV